MARLAPLGLGLALALVVACGGGGGEGDSGSSESTGATSTTSTTAPTTSIGTTGLDDTTGVDSSGTTAGTESSGTTGSGIECPDFDFGDAFPAMDTGSNRGQTDDFSGSCAAEPGGLEYIYLWTVATSGGYRIDTGGSDYDTVLYLLDGGCDGAQLDCNDDIDYPNGIYSSLLDVQLEAGQVIAIVVDGYDAAAVGAFSINVHQVSCMPTDLGMMAPHVEMGSTVDMGNDDFSACGGEGAGDVAFNWTAPATSIYGFDLAGSGFDTVLYLQEGLTCDGALMACNDDGGAAIGPSLVARPFTMGDQITIGVDGYLLEEGDFTLTITDHGVAAGDCCATDMTPGCDDLAITTCVCDATAQCCTGEWDQICVGTHNLVCDGMCALTPGGTCCDDTSGMPGCDTTAVQDCVCEWLPDCCVLDWNVDCVAFAQQWCATDCT